LACASVSATTNATPSPTWRARLVHSTGRGASARFRPSRLLSGTRHGNELAPSAARSAPVITASTPGAASAADVSMPRISACACGERSTTPWAWPGTSTSSRNRPRPVTNRASSVRRTGWLVPNRVMIPSRRVQAARG
jgi:hypothetical protein